MNELQQILEKISTFASDQAEIRLATLVRAEGSTYRDVGARMLVEKNGNVYGTISGGCLEGDVVDTALRMGTESVLKEYDTTSEEDIYWGTGMGCGGVTTVLIENISDFAPYMKMKALLEKRIRCVAVTVFKVSEPGGFTGLSAVSDGTDAYAVNVDLLELYNEHIVSVLKKRRSTIRTIEYQGQTFETLFEHVEPIQQIVLFGDGHDVLPVMEVCKQLGWEVHIVATKESLALPERFPAASSIKAWSHMETLPNEQTPCVIMTHNYLLDKEILKTLLPSDVPYIGFLGPKKRGVRLLTEALDEGLKVSEEQKNRYYSPIGLDIGAASANEIAISVVSEILSVLRSRNGGNLRDRIGPIHGRKAIDQ